MTSLRVGIGFDVHRLEAGLPLVIGGVHVPHTAGLAGHSDADVLAHALCDAILGAAALGDIGRHFPDTDPSLRGISSLVLLERCATLAARSGLCVVNVDSCVVAEAPRLAPFVDAMRTALAGAIGVDVSRVGVKATTAEGLGPSGRREGIAAHAVALLGPSGGEELPG